MLIVPVDKRFIEVRVLTNIDSWTAEYQEDVTYMESPIETTIEKDSKGLTREQCVDFNLPFEPEHPEGELEYVFDWKWSKRLVDMYNVSEIQDNTGKGGFILIKYDGTAFVCKGSYKKAKEFFISFKMYHTEIENRKKIILK